MGIEVKDLMKGAEIKADMDRRTITGYGASFRNVDSYGEVIDYGAFAKTISERAGKIKTMYNHREAIGKPVELREDNLGLYVELKISKTSRGDEVLELVRDGVIDGMSIMYNTLQSEDTDGIRHLKELKLYEVGPVDFPANEEAVIEGVKALAEKLHQHRNAVSVDAVKAAIQSLEELIEAPQKSTPDTEPLIGTRLVEAMGSLSAMIADAVR